jgi:hypothetical protein
MTPLDEFIARWDAVAMPIPFHDVINTPVDTDALPALWGSAMLQSDRRADTTMGETPWVEESGAIIVGLFAKSGTGRNSLDAAATMLREMFHGYTSEDGSLSFTAVVGPEDIDPDAEGEWWRLGFTVPYVIESQRVDMDVLEARAAMSDFHEFVHDELGI